MRVLVTGGAGFIASHLVDAYLSRGDQVAVVDDLSTGRRENLNPAAKFYEMDITSGEMEKVFALERPDLLNHHAAQMDVRRSVEDPVFDATVNILGTLNLLQCCQQYNVREMIFASSGGAVYGEVEGDGANEDSPTCPIAPYGVSKLAAERYLHTYGINFGMKYTILRYGNVYGPRQDPYGEAGVVSIFLNALLRGKTPTIFGDGEQTRDYVFVRDVVAINLLCGEKTWGKTFNVGTGVKTTVNRLFSEVKLLMGFSGEADREPARTGELERSCLDCRLAAETVEWRALYDLPAGLRETVEYFRLEHSQATECQA